MLDKNAVAKNFDDVVARLSTRSGTLDLTSFQKLVAERRSLRDRQLLASGGQHGGDATTGPVRREVEAAFARVGAALPLTRAAHVDDLRVGGAQVVELDAEARPGIETGGLEAVL